MRFNRSLKVTILALVTATTSSPIPNIIATTISPAQTSSTPSPTPPLFQNAPFTQGNIITFINTDSTPRLIIFTSNPTSPSIPTLSLPSHATINQSIPDNWAGNAYAINASSSATSGILAEITFAPDKTWFDVSSISDPGDRDGIKVLRPAGDGGMPVSGCVEMEEPCGNSYLYASDDVETRDTGERVLVCYVGNGMVDGSVSNSTSVVAGSGVLVSPTIAPMATTTVTIVSPCSAAIYSPVNTPALQSVFSTSLVPIASVTPFISSSSSVLDSLQVASLAPNPITTITVTATITIIEVVTITSTSSSPTSTIYSMRRKRLRRDRKAHGHWRY